ncbi:major facilitator superfamily domain-containing protein [Massariosphaeria phaeospora]|uniref:Major facilitator superfamily domain-containing protein n=1 Tax=Massariosphaeria phaeospora TaxID=100035 RepID=A0A7C8IEY8_9PLEO|nr:major facilitator superfamily domain-containing protein [Massariosphaeria phaeospora]
MSETVEKGDAVVDATVVVREPTDTTTYASPRRLGFVVMIICCASFLCGLDQTIVATAVPRITDSFHALGDIAWWTSAYLLTSASLQLSYGRLYTLFSIKIVYLLAITIFCIGSLICATAPTSIALIIGRAIAGCGAAGIMSGSVLVLAASCPLEKRAALSGLMFMSLGISAVAGPFVGGALTDQATWRWCFWINLPICAALLLGICFVVKTPYEEKYRRMSWQEKVRNFDLPGTILLTAALVCIILALQLGGSVYPWSNGRVIALFVVSLVLFLSFIGIQSAFPSQRSFSPALIRNRSVSFAALYSGFISGGMFVVITYLPLWFQAIKNASALRSGVMITPLIASFVIMSALCGAATQVVGYYNPAMYLGVLLTAVGAGLLSSSTFNPGISSSAWIGYQVLYGLGAGAGVPPPMLVIQTVLPASDVPLGVCLVNLVQMLWSSVAVAIAQTVFVNELQKGVRDAVNIPGFDTSVLVNSGATDLSSMYSPDQLDKVLPAYSEAITKTFYIALALSCGAWFLALPVQWKSMKKK